LTTRGSVTSIEKILLTNSGAGYVTPPIITISGGGGTGAAATCSIETTGQGIVRFVMTDSGVGYSTVPNVTIQAPTASGISTTAVGIASLGKIAGNTVVRSIYIQDPGRGYTSAPTVTISDPETLTGLGTYLFNETIIGSRSQLEARVKEWDGTNKVLKISNVGIGATQPGFFPGENIIGKTSGASYPVSTYTQDDVYDKYTENDEFETLGDDLLDFSESNPFGTY